jgi:hypothetical protein
MYHDSLQSAEIDGAKQGNLQHLAWELQNKCPGRAACVE